LVCGLSEELRKKGNIGTEKDGNIPGVIRGILQSIQLKKGPGENIN
jgi:hypothetical protein